MTWNTDDMVKFNAILATEAIRFAPALLSDSLTNSLTNSLLLVDSFSGFDLGTSRNEWNNRRLEAYATMLVTFERNGRVVAESTIRCIAIG